MKLFYSFNSSAVIGFLMLATATPSMAYPSVTQICTEVGVELKKGVKDGRLQQQGGNPMLLRRRDDWGVVVKTI